MLHFTINNFKVLLRKNVGVVILAVLSILISSVMVFCVMDIFVRKADQLIGFDIEKRTYTISWWPKSDNLADGMAFYKYVRDEKLLPEVETWRIKQTFTEYDGQEIAQIWCDEDALNEFELYEGRLFTDREIESGEPVVIISREMQNNAALSVGDTLTVCGKKAVIIGIGSQAIIPLETMISFSHGGNSLLPNSINCVFVSEISEETMKLLRDNLRTAPHRVYDDNAAGIAALTGITVLICGALLLISVWNILGVLKKIIDINADSYKLARRLGLTKGKSKALLLLTPLLFLMISEMLGWVSYLAATVSSGRALSWPHFIIAEAITILIGYLLLSPKAGHIQKAWFRE